MRRQRTTTRAAGRRPARCARACCRGVPAHASARRSPPAMKDLRRPRRSMFCAHLARSGTLGPAAYPPANGANDEKRVAPHALTVTVHLTHLPRSNSSHRKRLPGARRDNSTAVTRGRRVGVGKSGRRPPQLGHLHERGAAERAPRPRPVRRSPHHRRSASRPQARPAPAAMPSQTGYVMSTIDPEIYAASITEESFVDGANGRPGIVRSTNRSVLRGTERSPNTHRSIPEPTPRRQGRGADRNDHFVPAASALVAASPPTPECGTARTAAAHDGALIHQARRHCRKWHLQRWHLADWRQ